MEPLFIFLKPFIYLIPLFPVIYLLDKYVMKKMKTRVKSEIQREQEYEKATSEFYDTYHEIKHHLKDDGFMEPKPGSEEHYQRWKAERESRKS